MTQIPQGFKIAGAKSAVPAGFKPVASQESININEEIGPLDAAAIAAGRGLTTIGRGVGLVDPEDPAVTKQFEQLEEDRPISTFIGELLGETAPFLLPGAAVGSIATLPARAAASTLLGAAEGAIITRGQGGDEGQQAIAAGVGGGAAGILEVVMPRVSRIGRKIIRRALKRDPVSSVIDEAGNPSQEFLDALRVEDSSLEDVIGLVKEEVADEFVQPDQIARKSFLESQGLTPTRAQVTRNASDFQTQQEAAKQSGRLRNALETQEAALTTRFDNAIFETQGRVGTNSTFDALTEKATVLDQEISQLYKQARELAPGEKNVRFNQLSETLRKLAPTNTRSGGNIEAIRGDLIEKGVIDENFQPTGKIDVETAEEVRKFMNSLYDGQNEFGNIGLRQLKDSLDDDVFSASGEDVFNQARSAKATFERDLSRAKINKFDSRKANLVRDVLENKINPDKFTDDVVLSKKWRADDIQQLKDYVTTSPKGEAAFNDLRADVMDSIKTRSFIGPKDENGFKALSRDKLEKAINQIGEKKMAVIFTPVENKFLKNMLEVAELREPVRGTQQGRGPSAQAIARMEEKLKGIPLLGNLVEFIDIDPQGRIALKAKPERAIKDITTGEAATRGVIPQAGAAAGIITADAVVGEDE